MCFLYQNEDITKYLNRELMLLLLCFTRNRQLLGDKEKNKANMKNDMMCHSHHKQM